MPRLHDDGTHWGPVSRGLHWAMAALILFQLGFGVAMVRQDDALVRFAWTQIHKSFGAVVFALALARILWRLSNRARPSLKAPRWQARAARVSHTLLYVGMVAMPLSGWVMASAAPTQDLLGIENRVFGGPALPDPWVPGDAGVEAVARAVHVGVAVGLALVLAVHVGAALWHHAVRRDRVLVAMIRGE
jgi:cytochrome b561